MWFLVFFFLLFSLVFSHDCRKRKDFNLWSVWCPAVLESIFWIAKVVSLACHTDIPREQGWRAVETWDGLEAACWSGHWAATQHNDLCGPLSLPRWALLPLLTLVLLFPDTLTMVTVALLWTCPQLVLVCPFVVATVKFSRERAWWDVLGVSGSWNPILCTGWGEDTEDLCAIPSPGSYRRRDWIYPGVLSSSGTSRWT